MAALGIVAACGDSGASSATTVDDRFIVPEVVVERAKVIAAAASAGDPQQVASFAAEGFEFDFDRPELTLVEHLELSQDEDILGRLEVILDSVPGRRLSPFGNGTVQELWVYPGLALDLASDWTDLQIEQALSSGLFSADELLEYQAADAYLGFSVGLTPEGEWIFFTSGRVGLTPK